MDEKRIERLQVMLGGQELKALDDWRFSRRMPSRASAVRLEEAGEALLSKG